MPRDSTRAAECATHHRDKGGGEEAGELGAEGRGRSGVLGRHGREQCAGGVDEAVLDAGGGDVEDYDERERADDLRGEYERARRDKKEGWRAPTSDAPRARRGGGGGGERS